MKILLEINPNYVLRYEAPKGCWLSTQDGLKNDYEKEWKLDQTEKCKQSDQREQGYTAESLR